MSDHLISIARKSAERNGGNPLECQVCHMELVQPVRLACQHYFCLDCLSAPGGCPLCARPFDETDVCEDAVLAYVIESSHERTEICANCDQVLQPMFFCETCQQPLCGRCRELTHKAKIFTTHHINLLEERGRLRGRVTCDVHNEPFILFCLDSKKLMCIECFNASSLERKSGNFVNIDLAHKICCDKLEKAVARLRMFQDELLEQLELRQRFATELDNNFNALVHELETNCEAVIEQIRTLKNSILNRLKAEKNDKENTVEVQSQTLENLQGPIRVNLLSASIFGSYASKIDLLHYYLDLSKAIQHTMSNRMERLTMSSELFVDFKQELATALSDEFFGGDADGGDGASAQDYHNHHHLHRRDSGRHVQQQQFPSVDISYLRAAAASQQQGALFASGGGGFSATTTVALTTASSSSSGELFSGVGRSSVDDGVSVNFDDAAGNHISIRLMGDLNATFAEYLQRVDAPLRGFTAEISTLSRALVDVQRDITLRRCVVGKDEFLCLLNSCEKLKSELDEHFSLVHNHFQPILREVWLEQAERIQRQKASYREKLDEMLYLQRFATRVVESAQKLRPFAFYIAAIISTLDARRTQVAHFSPMEQICQQISSLEPDSQQRIEAIEKEEECRRVAKIQEKLAAVPEAQLAMRNLKETRVPPPARPQPLVVVEGGRERGSLTFATTKSTAKRKPRKDNRSSDGSTGTVCLSPLPPSSALSEAEFRCTSSLASSSTTTTPPPLVPCHCCCQSPVPPLQLPTAGGAPSPNGSNNNSSIIIPFSPNNNINSNNELSALGEESAQLFAAAAAPKIPSIFGDDVVQKSDDIDDLLSLQIANKKNLHPPVPSSSSTAAAAASTTLVNSGGHWPSAVPKAATTADKNQSPLPPAVIQTKTSTSATAMATTTARASLPDSFTPETKVTADTTTPTKPIAAALAGNKTSHQLSPEMQTIANFIESQLKAISTSSSPSPCLDANKTEVEAQPTTLPVNLASPADANLATGQAISSTNVSGVSVDCLAENVMVGDAQSSAAIIVAPPPAPPPPPPHSPTALQRSLPIPPSKLAVRLTGNDALPPFSPSPSSTTPPTTTTVVALATPKSTTSAQSTLSKFVQQNLSVMNASEETFKARDRLLASIKERVKRIEPYDK